MKAEDCNLSNFYRTQSANFISTIYIYICIYIYIYIYTYINFMLHNDYSNERQVINMTVKRGHGLILFKESLISCLNNHVST